jgi:hypothetical protein
MMTEKDHYELAKWGVQVYFSEETHQPVTSSLNLARVLREDRSEIEENIFDFMPRVSCEEHDRLFAEKENHTRLADGVYHLDNFYEITFTGLALYLGWFVSAPQGRGVLKAYEEAFIELIEQSKDAEERIQEKPDIANLIEELEEQDAA